MRYSADGGPLSDAIVGIFDSGVGGLSVAREIHRALPAEALVYVADTAYCPYGDRPSAEVRTRALAISRHLQTIGAKVVVTACNTATGAALEAMRAEVSIPVVGLEPAVKTAVAKTKTGRIGVMATTGTVRSERFQRLVDTYASGVKVLAQPCPGLADLIEEGHLDDPRLHKRLAELTAPFREAEVDAVVLGCTHYAFVQEPIARQLGPGVELIDSAPAIARRVDHLLKERTAHAASREGRLTVLTTGDPDKVGPVVERLWGSRLGVEAVRI